MSKLRKCLDTFQNRTFVTGANVFFEKVMRGTGIVGTQRSGKRGCQSTVLILGVPDISYASGLSPSLKSPMTRSSWSSFSAYCSPSVSVYRLIPIVRDTPFFCSIGPTSDLLKHDAAQKAAYQKQRHYAKYRPKSLSDLCRRPRL